MGARPRCPVSTTDMERPRTVGGATAPPTALPGCAAPGTASRTMGCEVDARSGERGRRIGTGRPSGTSSRYSEGEALSASAGAGSGAVTYTVEIDREGATSWTGGSAAVDAAAVRPAARALESAVRLRERVATAAAEVVVAAAASALSAPMSAREPDGDTALLATLGRRGVSSMARSSSLRARSDGCEAWARADRSRSFTAGCCCRCCCRCCCCDSSASCCCCCCGGVSIAARSSCPLTFRRGANTGVASSSGSSCADCAGLSTASERRSSTTLRDGDGWRGGGWYGRLLRGGVLGDVSSRSRADSSSSVSRARRARSTAREDAVVCARIRCARGDGRDDVFERADSSDGAAWCALSDRLFCRLPPGGKTRT